MAKTKIQQMTMSKFYCCSCGKQVITLQRRNSRQREAGHLKKLFCFNCKKEWNCAEVREDYYNNSYTLEDFKIEFEGKNFDENGNRILPYRQFIAERNDR